MTTKVTDLAIFSIRELPKDQTLIVVIVRKDDVKSFHKGLGSHTDISESKAATLHALDRFFTNEKGIVDDKQLLSEVSKTLPGCTVEEYASISDIFDNFAPADWEGPVYSVFWIIDSKTGSVEIQPATSQQSDTVTQSTVTCSRCGKTLSFSCNFIADARKGGSTVHGNVNESDWDVWKGTVCQSCQMIFCEDCQDAWSLSPCRNCGKPVVPASRNILPAIPKKLSMEKPPFSMESLPISQRSKNENSAPNETNSSGKKEKESAPPQKNIEQNSPAKPKSKKNIYWLIALFVGIVGFIVYYKTSEPQRMYDQARNSQMNNNFSRSIQEYKEIIIKYPESQFASSAIKELPLVFADQYCFSDEIQETKLKFNPSNTDAKGVYPCSQKITLDEALTRFKGGAVDPNEIRFVLKLDESIVDDPYGLSIWGDSICNYDNGYSITPRQIKWRITLHDLFSSRNIATQEFLGDHYFCPDNYEFTVGERNVIQNGGEPSQNEISDFVKRTISSDLLTTNNSNQLSSTGLSPTVTPKMSSKAQNGKIAFIEDKDNKQGISILNLEDNKITQLNQEWGFGFSASPDGSKFAYTSSYNLPNQYIFVVDVGTGQKKKFASLGTNGWDYSWSPDGKRIAYEFHNESNGDDREIYAINVDGANID